MIRGGLARRPGVTQVMVATMSMAPPITAHHLPSIGTCGNKVETSPSHRNCCRAIQLIGKRSPVICRATLRWSHREVTAYVEAAQLDHEASLLWLLLWLFLWFFLAVADSKDLFARHWSTAVRCLPLVRF